MKEEFEAWWAEQNTRLGVAHHFTAWNAWLAATLKEREACAQVCENRVGAWSKNNDPALIAHLDSEANACATAIRMRSNATSERGE